MRHPHEGLSPGVVDAVKLVDAIASGQHPRVNGVKAGHRYVRSVGGGGGFSRGHVGEPVGQGAGLAVVNRRGTVAPAPAPCHPGADVIQHDLVGLESDGPEGNHRRPGVETIDGEHGHLVEVPVILVHFQQKRAAERPGAARPVPPMTGAGEHDAAGQRAGRLAASGGDGT